MVVSCRQVLNDNTHTSLVCSTPLGMAAGLAMRTTYNSDDPGALLVSGVLDSLSSRILIHMYTAHVEVRSWSLQFNESRFD